jgi:hypothetical protein
MRFRNSPYYFGPGKGHHTKAVSGAGFDGQLGREYCAVKSILQEQDSLSSPKVHTSSGLTSPGKAQ